MPDNAGWRKKIHGKSRETKDDKEHREAKESNELALNKTIPEGATAGDDCLERRRHGWRKTIHGSRPETPVAVTTLLDDVDDYPSERSESLMPTRDSKPKLIRYTSLFSGFKDAAKKSDSSKEPNFTEPWGEDSSFTFDGYGDPLVMIDSIRSHMSASSRQTIPWEHHNTLFCIFDEYRKTRESKDRLEVQVEHQARELQENQESWDDERCRYESEIRRLEVIIAKSTNGVEGVIKARQGSIVDRKHSYRNKPLKAGVQVTPRHMTSKQLDLEIRNKCSKVLLRRPVSPSRKMSVLSRQFGGKEDTSACATNAPSNSKQMTLSRRIESDARFIRRDHSTTQKEGSGYDARSFSSDGGDLLPDELPSPIVSGVECDALVALTELGTLVARRRGLNVDDFVKGITKLITGTMVSSNQPDRLRDPLRERVSMVNDSWPKSTVAPPPALRKFQLQPHLGSSQSQLQSFSFEPGEDDIHALRDDLQVPKSTERGYGLTHHHALKSEVISCSNENMAAMSHGVPWSSQIPLVGVSKSSKIPSPVVLIGRARSQKSASSMIALATMPYHGRQDSQSSVLTVHRNNSSEPSFTGAKRKSSNSSQVTDKSTSIRSQKGVEAATARKSVDVQVTR